MKPAAVFSIAISSLAALMTVGSAAADDVSSFYRGRQMRMIIFASAGGGYDSYARLLDRHIIRHIPGGPSIVATNMPGAGGSRPSITSPNRRRRMARS